LGRSCNGDVRSYGIGGGLHQCDGGRWEPHLNRCILLSLALFLGHRAVCRDVRAKSGVNNKSFLAPSIAKPRFFHCSFLVLGSPTPFNHMPCGGPMTAQAGSLSAVATPFPQTAYSANLVLNRFTKQNKLGRHVNVNNVMHAWTREQPQCPSPRFLMQTAALLLQPLAACATCQHA